ncbi:MAG: hypothetical protein ABWZ98_08170, partial [Nakamurella sp.]
MTDVVDNQTAPRNLRRTIVRCATLAGVTAGAWLAFSLTSTANAAEGPLDGAADALHGVSSSAGQLVDDVVQPVQPITTPAP